MAATTACRRPWAPGAGALDGGNRFDQQAAYLADHAPGRRYVFFVLALLLALGLDADRYQAETVNGGSGGLGLVVGPEGIE